MGMEEQKRTVGQRTAGVLSIITGAMYALFGLLAMIGGSLMGAVDGTSATNGTWVAVSGGLIMMLGIAQIVLGAFMCMTRRRGLSAIVLGVLHAATILLAIFTAMPWMTFVWSGVILAFCVVHVWTMNSVYGSEEFQQTSVTIA